MKNPDYDRLLSPTPIEFVILLLELIAPAVWRLRNFSPTDYLAHMLGHGFDPNGSRLPEWELKADREPIYVDEEIEPRGGGLPVGYGKDGFIYSEPTTRAQATAQKKAQEQDPTPITDDELRIMQRYDPPLLNIPLARKIKRYWLEGRSDKEAAVLAGCSPSYARHYRLAFEKAARRNT